VKPITAAQILLLDLQTEQTLRLQQQLLAEGDACTSRAKRGSASSASSAGHAAHAGHAGHAGHASGLRGKRRVKRPKEAKVIPQPVGIPRPDPPASEEEEADWCQVHRHGEARRLSRRERDRDGEREQARKPVSMPAGRPLLSQPEKAKVPQPERPAESKSGSGAPPPANAKAAPEAPTPDTALKLAAPEVPDAPLLSEASKDVLKVLSRPPPPALPPPCPAGQEILRWLHFEPAPEPTVLNDMGCLSGGTGGTPGVWLEKVEVEQPAGRDWRF
ncbi:unnamed protein product, partial [Effrenium voratum]